MPTNDAVLSGGRMRKIEARLAKRLPRPLAAQLRLRGQQRAYRRFIEARLGVAVDAPLEAPTPPVELVAETYGFTAADADAGADPSAYLASSYQGALDALRCAEASGTNLRTVGAILDFGCGAGKTLRAWREIHGVRLVGCDVNARQTDWASAHLPGIEFYATDPEPPLPFEDASFDLAHAASVFTHIPLDLHPAWLAEIGRLLRPDGVLIATVAGRAHIDAQLGAEGRSLLDEHGSATLPPSSSGVSNASRVTGQSDVFQTRAETIRVFGRALRLVDYLVASTGQDVVVLRRPR